MKYSTLALWALIAIGAVRSDELPVTETDVFIQSGEVSDSSINIMARCNSERDSWIRLMIDGLLYEESQAFEARDYTHTFVVKNLQSSSSYNYKVQCQGLAPDSETFTSMDGSFVTAPSSDDEETIRFVWAADLAGQGYGRNPEFKIPSVLTGRVLSGGYVVFETMKELNPHFALFQGDMIYADGPIPPVKVTPVGNWTNNPSKDFDAVTLDEFRYNWKYNFGDEKMQKFLSDTPVFVQWDDHEVTNNWYPGEIMGPSKYEPGTAVDSLYLNSLQAFYEFNPIMEGERIYRKQQFGKHLEIFFPDYRSYRDPNPGNEGTEPIAMMGREQLDWLKASLKESTATWKIISSHDPLGIVTGGPGDRDSFGNEDPRILGREFEIKELLEFIHTEDIEGVLSVTSDVHFTAFVSMDPERAEGGFKTFKPLEEFVIGPIHAGSFGPNYMDTSFGARYDYGTY